MSNTNILALSDSELYILACVLGNVEYNENPNVVSLLCKVHEVSDKKFELACEDYEKVVFYVNDSRTGKVSLDQFETIAFEGEAATHVKELLTKEEKAKQYDEVVRILYDNGHSVYHPALAQALVNYINQGE